MIKEDIEKFSEEVCLNCDRFYDCDSFYDENNIIECMKSMMNTESVVSRMLRENTGRILGDSGSIYGRHWEKNQRHIQTGDQVCDFYRNDKIVELYPRKPILDAFVESLHYTDECLKLERNIETIFDVERLVQDKDNDDFQPNDYVGSNVCYTANSEYNICSQEYQYCHFEHDDEPYIAISIHNGCDLRVGFTSTHIFKIDYDEDEFMRITETAYVCCDCGYNTYDVTGSNIEVYDFNTCTNIKGQDIYQKTYKDNDGYLRCVECDGIIMVR